MDLLALQDMSPDGLATELGIPGNLLAHHLKVLEDAGLIRRVTSSNDRRRTYVQALAPALAGLLPEPRATTAERVLFVCTHNSARSVLAEALWRQSSEVPAASAGTRPAEQVNAAARQAAARHGVHLGDKRPEALCDVLRPHDLVVSVCDAVNEDLGSIGNPRVHWSIPDPSEIGTATAFASTVTQLRQRIAVLAPRVCLPTGHR